MFVNCVTPPGTPLTSNEHLGDITLNRQGRDLSTKQVPNEVLAGFFPGAGEVAEMFSYFQAHTYLGSDSYDQIALANKIAGRQPTELSAWARVNFPARQNAQSAARCEKRKEIDFSRR